MKRTFSHPWRRRLITVDDDGVHEQRRGRAFASIPWDEMILLRRYEVRGERKRRIPIILMDDAGKEFMQYASEVWRQRCPERWRRGRERARRTADWIAYVWFPLATLAPSIACYVLLWTWDAPIPDEMRPEIQKLHYITIMAVLIVVGFAIWHAIWRRKARATDT